VSPNDCVEATLAVNIAGVPDIVALAVTVRVWADVPEVMVNPVACEFTGLAIIECLWSFLLAVAADPPTAVSPNTCVDGVEPSPPPTELQYTASEGL
jgi:hypothetical protein